MNHEILLDLKFLLHISNFSIMGNLNTIKINYNMTASS